MTDSMELACSVVRMDKHVIKVYFSEVLKHGLNFISFTTWKYRVTTYYTQKNNCVSLVLGTKETELSDVPLIVGGTIGAFVVLIIGAVFAVFFIRYEEY